MSLSQQCLTLTEWLNNHHNLGGSVHIVHDTISLVGSPESYINDLTDKFAALKLEDIINFMKADTLDNTMAFRDIIEDAAKFAYLKEQIRNNELLFKSQLLHEPWHDRYRVHPGSGRIAAMWDCFPDKPIDTIYIHFDEPGFEIPENSTQLHTATEVLNAVMYTYTNNIDLVIEPAFDLTDRDSEWNPPISTEANWQFLRYSEGKHFISYKEAWREYALDYWISLNS